MWGRGSACVVEYSSANKVPKKLLRLLCEAKTEQIGDEDRRFSSGSTPLPESGQWPADTIWNVVKLFH